MATSRSGLARALCNGWRRLPLKRSVAPDTYTVKKAKLNEGAMIHRQVFKRGPDSDLDPGWYAVRTHRGGDRNHEPFPFGPCAAIQDQTPSGARGAQARKDPGTGMVAGFARCGVSTGIVQRLEAAAA